MKSKPYYSGFFSFSLLMVAVGIDHVAALSLEKNRRRQVLIGTLASGKAFLTSPQSVKGAPTGPIAVIGASGRTGALCVVACLRRGIAVRALTRSGSWTFSDDGDINSNPLLSVVACDVKDLNSLAKNVQGCQGVIYAASASKNGGTAQEIDNAGVVSAAQACLGQGVSRYVVLSSTATTRPNSMGYKFTNVMGGIMDEKRKGEKAVEQLYRLTATKSSSYTIVRPGGLEEPKKNEVLGPAALEISQGDLLAGIISRADLAEATVELTRSLSPNLLNTALEIYYTSSAQPCEWRFGSLLRSGEAPRLHGDSYEELFQGVKPNVDYREV